MPPNDRLSEIREMLAAIPQGEWRANGPLMDGSYTDEDGQERGPIFEVGAENQPICEIECGWMDYDGMELGPAAVADLARFIASAPELLAWCVERLDRLERQLANEEAACIEAQAEVTTLKAEMLRRGWEAAQNA